MQSAFLSQVNYWAVLVSAAAYWILGSLWFSALFGKIWAAEVEKHGVKIKEPAKKEIIIKMLQTFVANLVAAVATAYVVFLAGSGTWLIGLKLGIICGVGFGAVAIVIAYTWESRSFKLVMIDCSYAVIGTTACGVILSVWR